MVGMKHLLKKLDVSLKISLFHCDFSTWVLFYQYLVSCMHCKVDKKRKSDTYFFKSQIILVWRDQFQALFDFIFYFWEKDISNWSNFKINNLILLLDRSFFFSKKIKKNLIVKYNEFVLQLFVISLINNKRFIINTISYVKL